MGFWLLGVESNPLRWNSIFPDGPDLEHSCQKRQHWFSPVNTPSIVGLVLGADPSPIGLVLLWHVLQAHQGFTLSPAFWALVACPFSA
ncbi:hypothetical protein ACFX2F_006638 [Malus domestica]